MLGIGDTILVERFKGIIFMDEKEYYSYTDTFLVYSKDFGDFNTSIMGKAKDPKDHIDWMYVKKDRKHSICRMMLIEKKWKNFDWIEEEVREWSNKGE